MKPLIRLLPSQSVWAMARSYIAGDSVPIAIDSAAGVLSERGLHTALYLLTTDRTDPSAVHQALDTQLQLIDQLATDQRFADSAARPTISIRPSNYTTAALHHGGDAAGAADTIRRICERAADKQVRLTLDMESRHWTDFTLELFAQLRSEGHDHVGTVLQSRLLRTERDIDRLPDNSRIRVVAGKYDEPEEVAYTDDAWANERMVTHARRLLERGHFVEFAINRRRNIQRFLVRAIEPTGLGPDRFEIQMSYGVPRDSYLRDLVDAGNTVRLYAPFTIGRAPAIDFLRQRLLDCPLKELPPLRKLSAGR